VNTFILWGDYLRTCAPWSNTWTLCGWIINCSGNASWALLFYFSLAAFNCRGVRVCD